MVSDLLTFLLLVNTASAKVIKSEGSCRLSSRGVLRRSEFRSRTCALCFSYTYSSGSHLSILACRDGALICPPDCRCPEEGGSGTLFALPDFTLAPNRTHPLSAALGHRLHISPQFAGYVRQCCEAAEACCDAGLAHNASRIVGACPATWDGWDCFGETALGEELRHACPAYIYGSPQNVIQRSEQELRSVKRCGLDGAWGVHPITKAEWTDYNGCSSFNEKNARVKLIVGVASFFLSVVAIIPAIVIFFTVRSLFCASVSIHRQLLISLLCSSLCYIFNTLVFILPGGPGEDMVHSNHALCRVMFTLQLRYFRLSNYMWMFCEGWYLHRLLVAAFDDQSHLLTYHLLGWGFPLVPTIIDSTLRIVYAEKNCWVTPMALSALEWVHRAPCLLSLFLNFFLMISIVVILVQKLQYSSTMEPAQYRKAVRGTLILLPMFGLHFVLTIYRANFFAYEIINVLLDGLQGFLVSVIICYTNHKVVDELGRRLNETRTRIEVRRESLHRLRSHAVASPSAVTSDTTQSRRFRFSKGLSIGSIDPPPFSPPPPELSPQPAARSPQLQSVTQF